jgi:predicted dehydrogenase
MNPLRRANQPSKTTLKMGKIIEMTCILNLHQRLWQKPFLLPEIIRGYTGELQDFVECVAYGREPLSNFQLACDTMRVAYAAYLPSEEGRRVDF